jgi:hypothetical protein
MREIINAHKILVGKYERKIKLGRSRRRYYNIKMDLKIR